MRFKVITEINDINEKLLNEINTLIKSEVTTITDCYILAPHNIREVDSELVLFCGEGNTLYLTPQPWKQKRFLNSGSTVLGFMAFPNDFKFSLKKNQIKLIEKIRDYLIKDDHLHGNNFNYTLETESIPEEYPRNNFFALNIFCRGSEEMCTFSDNNKVFFLFSDNITFRNSSLESLKITCNAIEDFYNEFK